MKLSSDLWHVENEQYDHDADVGKTEVGRPVSPGEGELPVELVGEHPAQLAQEEERPEVFEESPLLAAELVLGADPKVGGGAGLGLCPRPRQVHQVAVAPGLQTVPPSAHVCVCANLHWSPALLTSDHWP